MFIPPQNFPEEFPPKFLAEKTLNSHRHVMCSSTVGSMLLQFLVKGMRKFQYTGYIAKAGETFSCWRHSPAVLPSHWSRVYGCFSSRECCTMPFSVGYRLLKAYSVSNSWLTMSPSILPWQGAKENTDWQLPFTGF